MPTQKYLAEISRMKIGRRRDTLQLVSGVVLALVIIGALVSIASNPRFGWQTVGDYLFHPAILRGLLVTLEMTVIAMTVGVVIGVIVSTPSRVRSRSSWRGRSSSACATTAAIAACTRERVPWAIAAPAAAWAIVITLPV
mgnify:CR=1 FL=1